MNFMLSTRRILSAYAQKKKKKQQNKRISFFAKFALYYIFHSISILDKCN